MEINASMVKGKIVGQYVNSVLAKREVIRAGYEEAILLNEAGYVADGSGENIFIVRDDVLVTPPLQASILPGITRDSVMQIARDKGVEIVEREIARAELYTADEVFVTGTAAEVTPIREVDDHQIGEPGPITRLLQQGFDAAIHGRDSKYLDWLDVVTSDVPGEGAAAR